MNKQFHDEYKTWCKRPIANEFVYLWADGVYLGAGPGDERQDGTYPRAFAATNKNGSASVSLWVSSAVMQVAMILVFFSNNAWNVVLSITGVMILPAYIGSTGYLWKLMALGQYPPTAKIGKAAALICSVLGTIYGLWLVYAAGLQYMLGGAVFFAVGNLWALQDFEWVG